MLRRSVQRAHECSARVHGPELLHFGLPNLGSNMWRFHVVHSSLRGELVGVELHLPVEGHHQSKDKDLVVRSSDSTHEQGRDTTRGHGP